MLSRFWVQRRQEVRQLPGIDTIAPVGLVVVAQVFAYARLVTIADKAHTVIEWLIADKFLPAPEDQGNAGDKLATVDDRFLITAAGGPFAAHH
jgi:hypothetical protein